MLRVCHKLFRILKPFYLRVLIISIVFNHRVGISYSSQAFKTFLTNSAHLLAEWNSILALKKVFYSVRNYLVLQKRLFTHNTDPYSSWITNIVILWMMFKVQLFSLPN